MSTQPVIAKSRKLHMSWSMEVAEDLRAFHDVETVVGRLLLAWFKTTLQDVFESSRTRPCGWLQSLVAEGQAPETTPARLAELLTFGDWESSSAVLGNPNIPAEAWRSYAWINPNAALQNAALPLWLLENPLFWAGLDTITSDCLLTSDCWSSECLNSFVNYNLQRDLGSETLERFLDCPSITLEMGHAIERRLAQNAAPHSGEESSIEIPYIELNITKRVLAIDLDAEMVPEPS